MTNANTARAKIRILVLQLFTPERRRDVFATTGA
jgi:hypothetical protein